MGPQLNVRRLLDLVNQILGHCAGQRIAAHQNHDALGIAGKIHRGLARRVRASHYVNYLALAGQSFRRPAAIVDSRSLQPVNAGDFQPPPLYYSRNHQSVAGNLVAVAQFQNAVRPLDSYADRLLWRQYFDSKTTGLHYSPARQIATAEPAGKS